MKNKKKIIIAGSILLFVILMVALLVYFGSQQNSNRLTINEKKWLEDKNNTANLIDININNDIPVFGNNGSGIFFTFVEYLEKETGLRFNLIPYTKGSTISGDYSFKVSSNKKGLCFYQSDYVVLSKNMKSIVDIEDINDTIGVLNEDLEATKYYLNTNNVELKTYEKITDLLEEFDKEVIKYVILPNITYMNIILSKDYQIIDHIDDLKENFVLDLSGDNQILNSIITKYFNTWTESKLNQEFDKAYMNVYYYVKNLTDEQKTDLLSKQYIYGYVEYTPYEQVNNKELVGMNGGIINRFADLTGIEFSYKKYKNIDTLKEAIIKNEVDVAYNYFAIDTSNVVKTKVNMNIDYVVLSRYDKVINSLRSIENDIYVYQNTYLKDYIHDFLDRDIKVKTSLKDLSKIKNGVIIVDRHLYNYYRNTTFSQYFIVYEDEINVSNHFVIKNTNSEFVDLFNFYLMSANTNKLSSNGYNHLLETPQTFSLIRLIRDNIVAIILILMALIIAVNFLLRKKKQVIQIKKEDKIKFVDMLTSLKNRNYLNHNIAIWEENKVYPQTIIIVDLNNIKYINDNYGHEEGDNIIKRAANILINSQLENSDIIRTDGNEFLIYLVGHSEKEVISYMRRLYKELKELPHGFGAAMGYSIIDDDIKSIDDAINEATLDMRTNKER